MTKRTFTILLAAVAALPVHGCGPGDEPDEQASGGQGYASYVKESRVAQSLAATGGIKTGIAEFYMSKGRFPTSTDDILGGHTVEQLVHGDDAVIKSVEVREGSIVLTFNARVADGGTIELVPRTTDRMGLAWECRASRDIAAFAPARCR